MKTVYLVRHGENVANITRELSHRIIDYSLTDKGVEQAKQTAAHFSGRTVDLVVSSPLKRAVETADVIGRVLDLPVRVDEQFRELNVGTLETEGELEERWRVHHEIVDRWRAGDADAAFPDGEDLHQLTARFRAGMGDVLTRTRDAAIVVGHAGIFRFALAAVATWEDPDIKAPFNNCSISTLEFVDGLPGRVADWARADHLSGTAAEFVLGTFPRTATKRD